MAMYNSVICLLVKLTPLAFKKCLVSGRFKGSRCSRLVIRLCSPPLLLMMLSKIQEADEPHMINLILGSVYQYWFQ